MEEEGQGPRLSKRFSDNKGGGEVDYKTKAGTAWSHSFLNQKPWHPLSYPNQRRKWIAEQHHAQHERRAEEVSREYAQEQEFFRQASLISKKEKEKMEIMQAVSFMYVRPPGYNAESAKAAEMSEKQQNVEQTGSNADPSSSEPQETGQAKEEKRNPRPKDVFGRSLPTEQEFEVLKNAPRLDTGVAGRARPFGVEVRNVKCVRCGTFGHQSGDRECPLKDAIMPSEESRIKRDDPLNAILAHADAMEPLKWELKQKPGLSPPRGGFNPDDPNQQIVAEEIFDEYGGFLGDGMVPELLASFHSTKHKRKSQKKSKNRKHRESTEDDDKGANRRGKSKRKESSKDKIYQSSTEDDEDGERRKKLRGKQSKNKKYYSSTDDDGHGDEKRKKSRRKEKTIKHLKYDSSHDGQDDKNRKKSKRKGNDIRGSVRRGDDSSLDQSEGMEIERGPQERKGKRKQSFSFEDQEDFDQHKQRHSSRLHRKFSGTSHHKKRSVSPYDANGEGRWMKEKSHVMETHEKGYVHGAPANAELERHRKRPKKSNKKRSYSSDSSDSDDHYRTRYHHQSHRHR